MEVIREIRIVEQGEITLRLPKMFWGREVEIVILPAPVPDKAHSKKRSLRGCLQSYARPELIATESAAWLEAVEDKHVAR